MLLSLDDNLHVKKIKIGSFHFIADQKILQSDWIRDTETTPNQKVVVSGATFPWYLHSKIPWWSSDSFSRYWWSWNPAIWLDERHNWPHPTKLIDSFKIYWWKKNPAKSDLINKTGHTQPESGNLRCYLILISIQKKKKLRSFESFHR